MWHLQSVRSPPVRRFHSSFRRAKIKPASHQRHTDGQTQAAKRGSAVEGRKTACCDSYGPYSVWFPLATVPVKKAEEGEKKRQINIVIRSFRLNTTRFYCHSVFAGVFFFSCFFGAIQSAVTVTNASQSIAGEISKLTTRMSRLVFFFFLLLFPFFLPHPNINAATSPPIYLHPHRLQNGQRVKQWSRAHKKTAVINKHNKTLI